MKLTIDASVFVARFVAGDVFHDSCLKLVRRVHHPGIQAHAPSLVFAEVAGAVSRICQDHVRGDLASLHLQRLPWLRIRPLDLPFGLRAAVLASRHGLRGAEAPMPRWPGRPGLCSSPWMRKCWRWTQRSPPR